jgi:zinc/manganese transport system substrate-binding protein
MHRIAIAIILAFGLLADSCAAAPLKIVASFSILANLARQIGGNHVAVASLVGPDSDIHSFEPRAGDAALLAKANLVIVNGLGLEGWMDRLIAASGYSGKIVTASDGVPPLASAQAGENAVSDPHAWQDIANARLYVERIMKALVAADPRNQEAYRRNGAALDAELAQLDAWVRAEIATIPPSRRLVISSHDAFGYFAHAYGVKFVAPVGLSTEDEPRARTLRNLAEQIRRSSIRTLLLENMSDPKLLRQIAAETGARIGGELYADALSAPAGPAGSYQAMMKHNVDVLIKAMRQ